MWEKSNVAWCNVAIWEPGHARSPGGDARNV